MSANNKVIISNGFQKFHLSVAAAEAYKRDTLSGFLTGAYPTPAVRKVIGFRFFRNSPKIMRLAARKDDIPDSLVHPFFISEAIFAYGAQFRSYGVVIKAFERYGRLSAKYVEKAAADGAKIYHYRAGYGGESVEVAKRSGMVALCDHSIAHSATVEFLIENEGRIPERQEQTNLSLFNDYILRDIEQADAVLVNSDFVKSTFNAADSRLPVHVIYLGVDDAFLDQTPKREPWNEQPRILFAGYFQKRKGAETLIEALARLDDKPFRLTVAGGIESGMKSRYPSFFSDSRTTFLGMISRPELASTMSRHEIFVFPSLAEGSARVVFEALACGMYVITTPNAGSIVEDGVHGRIVLPGDAGALAAAIQDALSNPEAVREIGLRNAQLIQMQYRQSQYGEKLASLYSDLLIAR